MPVPSSGSALCTKKMWVSRIASDANHSSHSGQTLVVMSEVSAYEEDVLLRHAIELEISNWDVGAGDAT